MFACGLVLTNYDITTRHRADDQYITRIARRRDLGVGNDAPFNEGALRFAVGSDTLIRP